MSEVKIFEMIFHFIPFPRCTHFHNRCEASRSSLQMKCKIAEQGSAITIKAKVGERREAGDLWQTGKSISTPSGEKGRREANERADTQRTIVRLLIKL